MKARGNQFIILAAASLLFFFVDACRVHETRKALFFRDLEQTPTFLATVDKLEFVNMPDPISTNEPTKLIDACIIGIRTASGEKLCLGSFNFEAQETGSFGRTLQLGKTYEFPKTWLDYKSHLQKRAAP
jgi:hypothetical protein